MAKERPRQVFVLRHGERSDKVPERALPYSIPHDTSLTYLGHLQAFKSAERLKELISPNASVHLVSSPFLRCLETATPVAAAFGVPIHIEESLCEWLNELAGVGALDDLTYLKKSPEELKSIVRGTELIINTSQFRPEFPESIEAGISRMKRAFDGYTNKTSEEVLIIVSHLFIIEALANIYTGRELLLVYPGYCKLSAFELNGEEYFMTLDADTTHAPQDL